MMSFSSSSTALLPPPSSCMYCQMFLISVFLRPNNSIVCVLFYTIAFKISEKNTGAKKYSFTVQALWDNNDFSCCSMSIFFPDFSVKLSASVGIIPIIRLHLLPANCLIIFNNTWDTHCSII